MVYHLAASRIYAPQSSDDSKELMGICQKVLCDEHCGRFEQRVRLTSQHVRHIMNFITDADETIDELIKKNPGLITNGVLRQFADFNGLADWLMEIVLDDDLLDRAAKKCDEWNLHYNIHIAVEKLGDLRYWSRTTLCCVTLLAVSQHEKDSDAELAELFSTNFNAFFEGRYWQDCEGEFADRLKERFVTDIVNRKEQMRYVSCQCKTQRQEIEKFLGGLGISYNGISSEKRRGKLCQQLYAHLNGVNMTDDENAVCERNMTNNDLCRCFTMEAKLRFLDLKKRELGINTPLAHWKNNGVISADALTDALRQAIFRTITWKDSQDRQYFRIQFMWICFQGLAASRPD